MIGLVKSELEESRTESSFDVNKVSERLAEALFEAGLDPESRTFCTLHKMLRDDLTWAVDNCGVLEDS